MKLIINDINLKKKLLKMIKLFYPGLKYLPEIDFLIRFKIACKCVIWRSKKIFFLYINNTKNYTRKLGIKSNNFP